MSQRDDTDLIGLDDDELLRRFHDAGILLDGEVLPEPERVTCYAAQPPCRVLARHKTRSAVIGVALIGGGVGFGLANVTTREAYGGSMEPDTIIWKAMDAWTTPVDSVTGDLRVDTVYHVRARQWKEDR